MLEYETRRRKPTIWNLLVFLVILAGFLLVYRNIKNDLVDEWVCVILALFFHAVLAELLVTFFHQLRYNPYSYNTIYYMGFALFVSWICITFIMLSIHLFQSPGSYPGWQILLPLEDSAKQFMLISSPFVLVFSVALCISNISLIIHEGFRFVNILGILLAVLMLGGEAVIFFADRFILVSGSAGQILFHEIWTNLFAAVYLYFECMIIGTIIADVIAALYDPRKNKDFLIILGCSIRKDGTPTPLLKGRCDRAVRFYRKQKKETGKELFFITSGGQGPDEVISESACMKQYLISQGIPEEQILEEDQSTNTEENMKYSRQLIMTKNPEGKIAYSTTNYHVFRSGITARRAGMRAFGMGARTKWYFWPNAAVREFISLLTGHLGKQIIILVSLVVVYVGLALLNYL